MQKVFALTKRIRGVCGGTSASKTISILVWLIDYCQTPQGRQKDAHVVSESFPHLEVGAMLDFQNLMKDRGYWKDEHWHGTKHEYTFETGNRLRFMSFDTDSKAHGPRRDVLFVNEANSLSYSVVDQLITRTREIVWLDWNPSEEFWFDTEIVSKRDDVDFLRLTYLDNEGLDPVSISEIESHKANLAWWRVYGLGLPGTTATRIYTNWRLDLDEIPFGARLERRWIDFGFTNDPTAIGSLYYFNGGYILDEEVYEKGMLNKDIADHIANLQFPKTLVIADSAEPKSIAELKLLGMNIVGALKGPDSIRTGIQVIQGNNIAVTKRSVNIIREYRKYNWMTDRHGRVLNTPAPGFDHHMDGFRYAMMSLVPIKQQQERSRNLMRNNNQATAKNPAL